MADTLLDDATFDDVDGLGDLFGDSQPPIQTSTVQKGLLERLDELATNGCCQ